MQQRRRQTWQHDYLRLTATAVQAPASVNSFSLWVHTSSHPAARFTRVWRRLSRKHRIDWPIRGLLYLTRCSSMRKSRVEICACQLAGGGDQPDPQWRDILKADGLPSVSSLKEVLIMYSYQGSILKNRHKPPWLIAHSKQGDIFMTLESATCIWKPCLRPFRLTHTQMSLTATSLHISALLLIDMDDAVHSSWQEHGCCI